MIHGVLLLLALLAAACASPARVTFTNATPERPREIAADTYVPDGGGSFPAVVLLHGCEGVSETTRRWARWLRGRGYLALVVDSWGPRGLAHTCAFTVPDPPATERLDDALGALRHLHARADVDRARIAVMGWSNGGVFALAAVNAPSLERAAARGVALPAPGFRAAVAIYPGGCESLIGQRLARPTLILAAAADDWTPAAPCVELGTAMRAAGEDVRVEVFAGAYHYFDVEGLARTELSEVGNDNRPGGCCGATVAYDAAAARAARARVAEFLGYHLGPLKNQ
ncbi:MAG: dienelactone hydrolase family protein [Candidatus Rokubacteria bacterium]|nr:dienelactone hydrolase family protein [Candidatus Rokubacteria bacterium]